MFIFEVVIELNDERIVELPQQSNFLLDPPLYLLPLLSTSFLPDLNILDSIHPLIMFVLQIDDVTELSFAGDR